VIIPEEVIIREIPRRVPDPAAETAIIENFVNYGFRVVDPEQIRLIRYSELVTLAIQGDPEAILQLSERFSADILVLGEAVSVVEVTGVPGQPTLQQGRARVELRVIEAATGRILAADALHTGGIDFTPEIAGKKSLERAGTKIACKLAQALAAFLPSGCFTSCSLPNPTYGGMPFDNAAGFPVPGDDLTTMVETALSQKGLTVSPPLAADYVVTGVISDWGVTMSPMIRIPLIDLLFRAGIMWMKVDMRVLNLDTSEIQADLITVSIEGIEIFGFQFGLNPRDLAREAAERIAERVASLSVVTVSAADSSKTQADRKLRSPITELVVRRQPQGWRFSLPMGASGEIQLQIYDLSGRKVFDSGRVSGHALTWKAQNAVGEPVANGIYVYVVTARTLDGRILKSEVKKLAILR
jgi:curli biogenesis system outer membrane secretion channel CsgG